MEIRRLQAKKIIKTLGNSFTSPFLVLAEDSNQYVVKPNTLKRNDLELIAVESLATELGALLNLPIPEWAVIVLDEGITATTPNAPEPGEYFGSKYLSEGIVLSKQSAPSIPKRPISNKDDAPRCLAFDAMIENTDRHPGNVMLVAEDKKVKVYLIDHGHILGGPGWPALSNPTGSNLYKQRSPATLANAFGVEMSSLTKKAKEQCSSFKESAMEHLDRIRYLAGKIPSFWWNGKPSDVFASFIEQRVPVLCALLSGD